MSTEVERLRLSCSLFHSFGAARENFMRWSFRHLKEEFHYWPFFFSLCSFDQNGAQRNLCSSTPSRKRKLSTNCKEFHLLLLWSLRLQTKSIISLMLVIPFVNPICNINKAYCHRSQLQNWHVSIVQHLKLLKYPNTEALGNQNNCFSKDKNLVWIKKTKEIKWEVGTYW